MLSVKCGRAKAGNRQPTWKCSEHRPCAGAQAGRALQQVTKRRSPTDVALLLSVSNTVLLLALLGGLAHAAVLARSGGLQDALEAWLPAPALGDPAAAQGLFALVRPRLPQPASVGPGVRSPARRSCRTAEDRTSCCSRCRPEAALLLSGVQGPGVGLLYQSAGARLQQAAAAQRGVSD